MRRPNHLHLHYSEAHPLVSVLVSRNPYQSARHHGFGRESGRQSDGRSGGRCGNQVVGRAGGWSGSRVTCFFPPKSSDP